MNMAMDEGGVGGTTISTPPTISTRHSDYGQDASQGATGDGHQHSPGDTAVVCIDTEVS